MQIVIDIDERDYESAKDGHIPFNVLDVIMNGTPLPKWHGRLIDADALINNSCFYETEMDLRDKAPTIIEADNERSEYKMIN